MHLHNRQIKATFWNDTDLLMWPRDKRWFYEGLLHLADDSGCLEDSPFAFKLNLFASPIDGDITMDVLAQWRDEIIEAGKLVRYTSGRKECLYLVNFHKHQSLKNPEKPDVPLPEWIEFEPYESNNRTGKYKVSYEVLTKFLRSSDDVLLIEEKLREVKLREVKTTEEKRTAFPFCSDEVAATSVKDDMNLSSSLELKYRNALRIYESSGFGPLDSTVQQTIDAMCDDFTENWFTQAVEEAVLQNKRRLAYVRSILQNWRAEGGVRRSGGVEVELSVHRKGNPSTRRSDDNPKKSITGGQIGWIAPRESS